MKYTADQQYYSKPQIRIPEPRVRLYSKVHTSTHLQHISVEMCNSVLGAVFQFLWGHFSTIQRTWGIAFR